LQNVRFSPLNTEWLFSAVQKIGCIFIPELLSDFDAFANKPLPGVAWAANALIYRCFMPDTFQKNPKK
jgi:hypothetical protein